MDIKENYIMQTGLLHPIGKNMLLFYCLFVVCCVGCRASLEKTYFVGGQPVRVEYIPGKKYDIKYIRQNNEQRSLLVLFTKEGRKIQIVGADNRILLKISEVEGKVQSAMEDPQLSYDVNWENGIEVRIVKDTGVVIFKERSRDAGKEIHEIFGPNDTMIDSF